MAGHSKWAQIKRKKAVTDAKRGQQFTKLARAITVAAREGGGDVDANAVLANAVQKAKAASMPKENIERAIAKGTGSDGEAQQLERVVYEGYGPGGVALLIEALTDNRNRTGSDVRYLLTKNGGSLGEPGSVAYLFNKQGLITVDANRYQEEQLMIAVDVGALDIGTDEDLYEITTQPGDLDRVRKALEQEGVEIQDSEVAQQPSAKVSVELKQAEKLMRLINALDDNDDVEAVHANFDIDDEVLERLNS